MCCATLQGRCLPKGYHNDVQKLMISAAAWLLTLSWMSGVQLLLNLSDVKKSLDIAFVWIYFIASIAFFFVAFAVGRCVGFCQPSSPSTPTVQVKVAPTPPSHPGADAGDLVVVPPGAQATAARGHGAETGGVAVILSEVKEAPKRVLSVLQQLFISTADFVTAYAFYLAVSVTVRHAIGMPNSRAFIFGYVLGETLPLWATCLVFGVMLLLSIVLTIVVNWLHRRFKGGVDLIPGTEIDDVSLRQIGAAGAFCLKQAQGGLAFLCGDSFNAVFMAIWVPFLSEAEFAGVVALRAPLCLVYAFLMTWIPVVVCVWVARARRPGANAA